MNLYKLTSSHVGGAQYPWVGGYGPLAMRKMEPFLSGMPDDFRRSKLDSWKINNDPPGLQIDAGGTTWSHFIGCGGGPPLCFVSEDVIADLKEAGIGILRTTEMPIASIKAKRLQKIPAPKYYILEALPGIARAWDAMGVPVDEEGHPIPETMPFPRPELLLRLSSWNGLDLMSFSDGPQTTALICTDRVKDLAESKKWTNVKFMPIKSV